MQRIDGFELARTPTLNAAFRLFLPQHGIESSHFSAEYEKISPADDTPVIFVTWYDAWAFCQWAHWDGRSCRLPHEDEWEYAAKAGTPWDQNYWWGDEFDTDKCNADSRVGSTTPPTESHQNPWGLIDMLGNVCGMDGR